MTPLKLFFLSSCWKSAELDQHKNGVLDFRKKMEPVANVVKPRGLSCSPQPVWPGHGPYIIIILEICKAPTLRLKALTKHTHIMCIEMENVIKKKYKKTTRVFQHYARDARAHTHTHTHTRARTHARTHAHTHTHTHTHTLYRLIGVKDNVA